MDWDLLWSLLIVGAPAWAIVLLYIAFRIVPRRFGFLRVILVVSAVGLVHCNTDNGYGMHLLLVTKTGI